MKQGQLRMRMLRQLKRITDSSLRSKREIGWNENVSKDVLSKVFRHRCGCHSGIFHMVSIFPCSYRKSERFAAPGLSWLPPELLCSVEFVEATRGNKRSVRPARGNESPSVGVQFRIFALATMD